MKNLALLSMILLLFLNSCASYTPVNPEPKNLESMIKKGDELKIGTKNGEMIELEVDHLTEEAIVGEKKTVPYSDISKLEIMTSSTSENIIGGIVIGIFASIFVLLEAALDSDDHYYHDPDEWTRSRR